MIEAIHTREESWEGWPFTSVAEFAECAAELEALVQEAGGEGAPWISIEVRYGDREYQPKSIEEFSQAAGELDLETLHSLSVMIFREDSDPVGATLEIEGGTYHRETGLRVSGRKGTAVDGVNVQAKAAIDRWARKTRETRDAASVDTAGGSAEDAAASLPAWRRLLDHPLFIQVAGGVVAAVVAGVILVLILH